MRFAARVMSSVAKIAVAGPWRDIIEAFAVRLGHYQPENRIINSFCKHIGLQLVKREKNAERIATLSSGGKMLLAFDVNSIMYYFLGSMASPEEFAVEKLLKRVLRKGDIFFDIGSNVGFYTFFAAPLCGETGSIHAFEANSALKVNLLRSAALNQFSDRININSVAVGETHGGEACLYMPTDTQAIGIPSTYLHEWLNPELKMSVPLISIDGYIHEKRLPRVDVIKIDIEGAELVAFKGMKNTLNNTPPTLIICELMSNFITSKEGVSLHRDSSAPTSIEVVEFMRTHDYYPCHINKQTGLLDNPICMNKLEKTSGTINVGFIRPELQKIRPELFSPVFEQQPV